ncbi:N-6 DNA methylase [Prevotella bivia DNF00320]|uniref:N-6 DNA methylase n=1 Tax=Prevotella bivia DNF00320 TaxID=1401068 RepID=A0A096BL09_9BACT|nr:N-6 DNA methylase [Prevotella bivia]KGF43387.1 N-6 DNA methylase [Prevotella bivia DNF00320]
MTIQIKDNKIYAPLKDKWLVLKPEEEVRQKYISRLADSYGYTFDQMGQELQVTNSKRGQGSARADIVIWKSKEDKEGKKYPLIVVECKAESVTIHKEDYYQGMNYASWAHADFFVTTNLKETRIFKIVKGQIPDKLDEIVDIPNAEQAGNRKEIDKLLKQTKAFTRDEFSKLLFKCHNIIRNNDKLSPEAAFDEISKILFIKIRYERENDEGQIFSKERFVVNRKAYEKLNKEMGVTDAIPFYQNLFEKTKQQFANDHLFDDNAKIEIRENSFEQIVKELEIYNLSTTSDDVKGIAFEKFLGKTFRGELGQFFTPRTIVDFMVSILDPQEGELVCDPCCGSGGFLIKTFEYVREKIEKDIEQQKEGIKTEEYGEDYDKMSDKKKQQIEAEVAQTFSYLNEELNINNEKGRLRSLSFDCIYGTDANPRMARTAKMNMIMHGDGHGGVHHHDGLLNVNGIFENRFDIILTNPPFGARVEKDLKISEADRFTDEAKIEEYVNRYGEAYKQALRQVNDHIGKSLLSLYNIESSLTEVLFIERCLNLLKPGGRMGIVLPEGVLNNTNLQKARDFVEGKAKILLIVSIPQDVFIASGATVKPSLLFFKKFTEDEAATYSQIQSEAQITVTSKYQEEIDELQEKLKLRGNEAPSKEERKDYRAKLKALQEKIEMEVKAVVKEKFDYEIPIAEIQKAGISTTGAEIENDLIPLAKEYTPYRIENNLWGVPIKKIGYKTDDEGYTFRYRMTDGIVSEPEPFYDAKK